MLRSRSRSSRADVSPGFDSSRVSKLLSRMLEMDEEKANFKVEEKANIKVEENGNIKAKKIRDKYGELRPLVCPVKRFVGCVKSRVQHLRWYIHCEEATECCNGFHAKISWRSPVPVDLKVGDWISFEAAWEVFDGVPDWSYSPLATKIKSAKRPTGSSYKIPRDLCGGTRANAKSLAY